MNQIERYVTVLNDGPKEPIEYVRATNAIPIVFNFTDYTIPEGSTATVVCLKPSGMGTDDTAEISGNSVTITVKNQMFMELGKTELQVAITNGDSTLVTFSWPVMVKPNYTEGDFPPSQNESTFFEELQQAADNANTAAENANQAAQNIGTAVTDAQEAAQAANTAAQAATQGAQAANTAAQAANTAAQGAGEAEESANTAAQAANQAAQGANIATEAANTAAQSANTAADSANQAAQSANTAADSANAAAEAITPEVLQNYVNNYFQTHPVYIATPELSGTTLIFSNSVNPTDQLQQQVSALQEFAAQFDGKTIYTA